MAGPTSQASVLGSTPKKAPKKGRSAERPLAAEPGCGHPSARPAWDSERKWLQPMHINVAD